MFKVDGTTLNKAADLDAVWNQGVAWSRDGKTLLVQSMGEQLLSVVSFDGKTLKATGEIETKGGPEGIRVAEK